MTDDGTVEKEKHMKQLKRRMECWREIILPLNSILLWECRWHPVLIIGFVNVIFSTIWILEPALLTMISVCLLVFALVDYLVPILTSVLCNAQSWTGQKEKKLIEICQNLSSTILQMQCAWTSISKIRHDRPNIYYSATILFLILFAWLGSTINNLLLLYTIVLTVLLMPGLRHKGRARLALKHLYDHLIRRHLS
ncbi:PREDICTED: ADP-ribosylation factor-like protein 6-interacting protein 1 [Wasmannia auropunctata]|uniref:ADP-ribosylation factor-like protein 6-interacting protein 1 n=1 Tax=Wasmannia auropunctata TaxID=64793 RepID=UPI0005EDAC25|nr:PREDICTED: ADP-ribosylation factor-like protein 6-interacting protein 1 [Wasmannia auropunctata]